MVGYVIFLVGLIAAAVFDIRHRRVPNVLTIALLGSGLILSMLSGRHVFEICQGVLVAFIVILPFFYFRVYRGGDAKLLIACGAWVSVTEWLIGFAVGMAFGAIHGVWLLIRYPDERTEAARSLSLLYWSRLHTLGDERDEQRPTVPMALSFSCGMVLVSCMNLTRSLGLEV